MYLNRKVRAYASARAENLTLRLRFDDDGISRLKPDFALVVLKYWVLKVGLLIFGGIVPSSIAPTVLSKWCLA